MVLQIVISFCILTKKVLDSDIAKSKSQANEHIKKMNNKYKLNRKLFNFIDMSYSSFLLSDQCSLFLSQKENYKSY